MADIENQTLADLEIIAQKRSEFENDQKVAIQDGNALLASFYGALLSASRAHAKRLAIRRTQEEEKARKAEIKELREQARQGASAAR